ncbi:hypothetical protein SK128_010836 [Halocaridina rubra]|uniref:Uncharacterized protein n=1 Tax=Halocaridina rubra TaxID=373956 RepID=A0AAN8XFF5_HALRR
MDPRKLLCWGILVLSASNCFCSSRIDTLASNQPSVKEKWHQMLSTEESNVITRESQSSEMFTKPTPGFDGLNKVVTDHSDASGLLTNKSATRKKRGSGVVIRGPFYPYPRRGHPLRYTSGCFHLKPSVTLSLLPVALLLSLPYFITPLRW